MHIRQNCVPQPTIPEIDTAVQGHIQAGSISSSDTCSLAAYNTELPNVASMDG